MNKRPRVLCNKVILVSDLVNEPLLVPIKLDRLVPEQLSPQILGLPQQAEADNQISSQEQIVGIQSNEACQESKFTDTKTTIEQKLCRLILKLNTYEEDQRAFKLYSAVDYGSDTTFTSNSNYRLLESEVCLARRTISELTSLLFDIAKLKHRLRMHCVSEKLEEFDTSSVNQKIIREIIGAKVGPEALLQLTALELVQSQTLEEWERKLDTLSNKQAQQKNYERLKALQRRAHWRPPTVGDGTWPVIGNRYQLLGLVSQGEWGEIYKAYDLLSAEFVAVKIAVNDSIIEKCADSEVKVTFCYPRFICNCHIEMLSERKP